MSPSPPVFGKRNRSHAVARVAAPPARASAARDDHAAFFTAVRAEMTETPEQMRVLVPLSFKAAFLAGLVVACGLVGFDLTGGDEAARVTGFAATLGFPVEIGGSLMPVMMLLGLLGGGRTAATTLIVVHGLLGRAGHTSRLVYAAGGGAAALCVAAAMLVLLGHAPAHGWAVDVLAGIAAGFLYRVFAGTRPA